MLNRLTGQPLAVISTLLLSTLCFAAQTDSEPLSEATPQSSDRSPIVLPHSEQTRIENLIPMLDAYYGELNKQLDKHLQNRKQSPNSPFAKLPEKQKPSNLQFKPSTPAENTSNYSLLSQDSPSQLPPMIFRGLMQSKGKKLALLEVIGLGTFVVKEGDKVGLQQMGDSSAVLHILEINELNLIVETGSYGQQMVVQ